VGCSAQLREDETVIMIKNVLSQFLINVRGETVWRQKLGSVKKQTSLKIAFKTTIVAVHVYV